MPIALTAALPFSISASRDEREHLYPARLRSLIETLESTGATISMFCTGAWLETLSAEQPDAIERLRSLGDQLDWLGGSMYGAALGALSERDRREQLSRTDALLKKLLGVSATGVWLGDDWDRSLPATLVRAGYDFALVEERLDQAGSSGAGTATWQGRTLAILPVQEETGEDGFFAIKWSPDSKDLDTSVAQLLGSADLETVSAAYGRLSGPVPRKALAETVGPHLDTAHLSRRLRKAGTTARTHLLRSQTTLHRQTDLIYAGEEMIRAQIAFDAEQHRTRGWCNTELLDWAGELTSDLHVELPDQSWVLDTHRGSLRYFDEKPSVWPVSAQRLARQPEHGRWLADRWEGDDRDVPFKLKSRETQRGSITAVVHRPGLEKTLRASDRRLSVHYDFDGLSFERFGPEFTVQSPSLMLRIDGGAWRTPSDGDVLPGHRFRLRDESRSTEITIDLPVPGYLGVEQETDEKREYRFWPHFIASGATTYDVSLTFSDVIEPTTNITD